MSRAEKAGTLPALPPANNRAYGGGMHYSQLVQQIIYKQEQERVEKRRLIEKIACEILPPSKFSKLENVMQALISHKIVKKKLKSEKYEIISKWGEYIIVEVWREKLKGNGIKRKEFLTLFSNTNFENVLSNIHKSKKSHISEALRKDLPK